MNNVKKRFGDLKKTIILNLKINFEKKLKDFNNILDEEINIEKLKSRPKGFFKSAIANYKNNDSNFSDTIASLFFLSSPIILFFTTTILAILINSLAGSILFSVFGVAFSIFLLFIMLEEASYTTIADRKILKIEELKGNINDILPQKKDKIENIFENNDQDRFENILKINHEKINNESFSLFKENIDIDTFNLLKKAFSKEELISLLSESNNNNITYDLLIEFINKAERKENAEILYKSMFEQKKESNILEKEKICI